MSEKWLLCISHAVMWLLGRYSTGHRGGCMCNLSVHEAKGCLAALAGYN